MMRAFIRLQRRLLRALWPVMPLWVRKFGALSLICTRCQFEVDYRGSAQEQASRAVDHSFTEHA